MLDPPKAARRSALFYHARAPRATRTMILRRGPPDTAAQGRVGYEHTNIMAVNPRPFLALRFLRDRRPAAPGSAARRAALSHGLAARNHPAGTSRRATPLRGYRRHDEPASDRPPIEYLAMTGNSYFRSRRSVTFATAVRFAVGGAWHMDRTPRMVCENSIL